MLLVYPELELTAFFAYFNFDIKYLLICQHRKTVDISVFSEHFYTNVQNFIFFMFITFCAASLESGSEWEISLNTSHQTNDIFGYSGNIGMKRHKDLPVIGIKGHSIAAYASHILTNGNFI
jgi:hypothetical protein